MNVLYLHCHDAGRFVAPYGHDLPTPNLTRFAQGATLFRQAFCAGPTCSPSRVGLLSGMPPHEAGMLGLCHRGFQMEKPERHLAAWLREHGYYTALAGVQHEFPRNSPQPYDRKIEAPVAKELPGDGGEALRIKDLTIAEATRDFLRCYDEEKPFFLSCGFALPHRAFPLTPRPDPARVAVPTCLPDTPEVREDMATYHAAIASLDLCMGIVLQALRESGQDRRTLVLVTTDHGIAFPMMKCHLTDSGIGVMLMMDYPDNRVRGQACDALVSQLDLFPTICELVGVPKPDWLRGRSMVPLFQQPDLEIREEIFSEVTFHAGYEPMRCVRTKRHKLIKYFDEETRPLKVNCDDSPSKQVMLKAGWFDTPRDRLMLFDLLQDPNERHNLAMDPYHAELRADLEGRLARWMSATDDPLLRGPVAAPPGAKINSRQQSSAQEKPVEV